MTRVLLSFNIIIHVPNAAPARGAELIERKSVTKALEIVSYSGFCSIQMQKQSERD